MCGGRGTRLDVATEKPLVEVGGRPMVDRVLGALAAAAVESIRAAVSPWTPETTAHLRDADRVSVVETAGDGYVADLQTVLADTGTPVLTIAADLPLLTASRVDRVIADASGADGSVTVCVPVALKRRLGCTIGETIFRRGRLLAPSGVNVVADGDGAAVRVVADDHLAVNVNGRQDLRVAERVCD